MVASRSARLHFLVATLLLALPLAPPARAGTLYRCVGDDGAVSYVSQRIHGERCIVASHYDSGARGQRVVHDGADAPPSRVDPAPASTPFQAPAYADARSTEAIGSGHVEDFGDPNDAAVAAKLREPGDGFRYVQIGDSHTAGDYLTDELRVRWQARLGDGGVGWVMPMKVSGQRLARVNYDVDGWQLVNSRSAGPADYPFGGFIAQVASEHAVLTIKSKQGNPVQTITAIVRQGPRDAPLVVADADGRQQLVHSPVADGRWHAVEFSARLPVTVLAEHSPDTAIGGWWLRAPQAGAVVSAVGINGSEQSQWSRWRSEWMADLEPGQPDLIGIAYGTNEAFGKSLDPALIRSDLEAAIDGLRQRFPHAAILILGASESLTSLGGRCGVRSPGLDAVQRMQRQVAIGRKTLYWDWQQAMGGNCSMKRWIGNGLGRGDGVHFSAAGYARLGDDLYDGLEGLARRLGGGEPARQAQRTGVTGSGR